jgi:uncharacterized protein with HEPN domain
MKPDKLTDQERIGHMLEAISFIRQFSANHDLESFSNDSRSYYACLFQYAIIGEAVANISREVLAKYPYPWFKVKSFRNFILHEYHAIDSRVVWDTTHVILPELEKILQEIQKYEFRSSI